LTLRTWLPVDGLLSRYLLAGVWNTAFGYGVFVCLIAWRGTPVNYLAIAIVSNVLAISNAYLVHKFLVFQTRGNYVREYFKYWLIYGVSAVLGVCLLAMLVSGFGLDVYAAQAGVVCGQIVLTFMGHRKFSFRAHGVPQRSGLELQR